jgi:predicted nucleotidyltransferase
LNKEVVNKLKLLKPILFKKYGVKRLGVFGSQVRDDYTDNSDIDIVIFSIKDKKFDTFMSLKYFLEKELGVSVDLGFYDRVSEYIKNEIKKDLLYV